MILKSIIKCSKCGTRNQNNDYCTNCGALINTTLRRRLETEKKILKRKQAEDSQKPGALALFIQKAQQHPNALIRWAASALYSIWTFLAMVLGALIAAVIAAAAG